MGLTKQAFCTLLFLLTIVGGAADKKLRRANKPHRTHPEGSALAEDISRLRRGEEIGASTRVLENLSYEYSNGKSGKDGLSYEYTDGDTAATETSSVDEMPTPGAGSGAEDVSPPGAPTGGDQTGAGQTGGGDFPVVVVNRADVDPSRMDEFLALADATVESSRNEPKVLLFDAFRALEGQGAPPGSSNTFVFYEIYEDMDGLNQHTNSPDRAEFLQFIESGGANFTTYITDGWNITSDRDTPSASDVPFISIAIADVSPDQMDEFMALTEASIEGSRQEAANLYWDVLKSPDDPNRWYFIEAYSNADGFLGDHQSQPYTTEFNEFIGGGGYTNNIWIVTEGYDMQGQPDSAPDGAPVAVAPTPDGEGESDDTEMAFNGVPVVVINRADVAPDRMDEFLTLADLSIEESRDEPKTLLYDVFQAIEGQGAPEGSNNTFIFYEIYEDMDGFNQHGVGSTFRPAFLQFITNGGATFTTYVTDGWNVTRDRDSVDPGDEPFISIAIADVNPDRMDEFLALTDASIEGSREEEANLYWDVLKSPDDPNRWYFIEAYSNPDGFWGDHQSQPYTTEFNEFIGGGGYTDNIWIVTEGYDMQ